jgi:hypothetical protein
MRVVTAGGATIELGTVETMPTIGITDYSRRVTDDFGVTTVVPRGFARTMQVKLAVPFDDADALQRQLAALRTTPARWIADDRFACMSVEGFFKDFSIDMAVPPLSYCTLTIEGTAGNEALPDNGADPAPDGRSTMQLLAPIAITDAGLVASSVSETDYAAWSNSLSYGKGARVILAATHRVYESAVDGNAGADPAGTSGKWLDIGPTNRWAMFDQALGSATSAQGSIVVTITAATIGAIALLDVAGATVRVQTASYDRTIPVGAGAITFLDLPPATTRATVTITGAGTVSVGTLLAGKVVGLGITEASPTAGITDYSRKVVDDFGEVTVVPRAWAKKMDGKTLVTTSAIDAVFARLAAVRATPALWIGHEGIDSLTIYGFVRDFALQVGETLSNLSLSIEGLSTAGKVEPFAPGGGSVAWPDITDPDGTKPKPNADKTSENTARDTAAVAGKPAVEVVAALDLIEPLPEAVTLIAKAQIDYDALQRQAARDGAQLREAVLRGILESDTTRTVMRDAGITVDPATGRVFIAAVDQVSQRTSRVEIDLDAAKTLIALSASRDYVNERIAAAQLDPTGQAALDEVLLRLTRAEVRLDGDEATIALKADATIVTLLSGRVTSVRTDLDALAGVVSTKAEKTEVDKLATTVSAVEQLIGDLGDTTGYRLEIREARYEADKAANNALEAIIAGDDLGRRQLVAAAQVRQELYTRLIEGDAAEVAARTLLSVRLGTAEAAAAAETFARVEQGKALAQATSALEAKLGQDIAATVRSLTKTITDGDQASATSITQLGARLDSFGGVTIEQSFKALVDRTGKIEGRYTVAVDANGNLAGFQLIGSDQGPASFNLINTDLRMGTGRVIFNNGTYMKVQGVGFGASGDFIEWYGPTMAINACTRANAISYLTTSGQAYFGGSLSAGVTKNAVQTTNTGPTASVATGVLRSNGRRRNIVLSYNWDRSVEMGGGNGGEARGDISATVILYRSGVEIGRLAASGTWARTAYAGVGDPETYTESMGGSITTNDDSGGTQVEYSATLVARTLGPSPTKNIQSDYYGQIISIVQTEE